jgi:hypothetical protein
VDSRWTVGGQSVDSRWTVGGQSVDSRWTVGPIVFFILGCFVGMLELLGLLLTSVS